MKNIYKISISIALALIAVPFFAAAQVQNNTWKVISNTLQPVLDTYGIKVPSLKSGSGTACITSSTTGLFATTTCGGGGLGTSTSTEILYNNNGAVGGFGSTDGTTLTIPRLVTTQAVGWRVYNGGQMVYYSDAGSTPTGSFAIPNTGVAQIYNLDKNANLNFAGITGSDKTFTFPNTSGTVALTSDITPSGWTSDQASKTNTLYNVGIGTGADSPRGIFDINQAQGTVTIGDVSGAEDIVFAYGSGDYNAVGLTWIYYVYAYKVVNGSPIYSVNPFQISGFDDGSSAPMSITGSWDAVTGADGYRIVVGEDDIVGASNDYYFDTPYTSFNIGGGGGVGNDVVSGNSYVFSSPVTVTPNSAYVSGPDFYVDGSTGEGLFANKFTVSNNAPNNTDSTASLGFKTGADFTTGYYAGDISVVQQAGGNTDNAMIFKLYNGAIPAGSEKARLTDAGLDVTGAITVNGSPLPTSQWTTSGSDIYYNTGNVSIGGTAVAPFTVRGSGFPRTSVYADNETSLAASYVASGNNTRFFQLASWGGSYSGGGNRFGFPVAGVNELVSFGATGFLIGTNNSAPVIFGYGDTEVFRINSTSAILMGEGKNIDLGGTTGTKIGLATTDKLGFFNATPIVQPANTVAINDVLVNLGERASGGVSNFSTNVAVGSTTAPYTLSVKGSGSTLPLQVASSSGVSLFQLDTQGRPQLAASSTGIVTLSSGAATVTTAVTNKSVIQLTLQNCSTCGTPYINGTTTTSFTIGSTNILDASVVGYTVWERP